MKKPSLHPALSKLAAGELAQLHVPVQKSLAVYAALLLDLQKAGYDGTYVTLFKPYPELAEAFSEAGVDLKRLLFVDGISEMNGHGKAVAARVRYIPSPFFLDEILAEVKRSLTVSRNKKRFVMFDSITAALLYNQVDRTLEFLEKLKALLKDRGPGLVVVMSVGPTDPELMHALKKIAAAEIDLRGWKS
jgi:archaellum biogenesis ATPase FlaH